MTAGPVVETTAGALAGIGLDDAQVWRGIPYAAPPVGDLRWRAPQLVTPWSGVRPATEFGPRAVQPEPEPGRLRVAALDDHMPTSEDCLYLNVATPAGEAPPGGWPVLVRLHGGGYQTGSGAAWDGGAPLARHGVVVVTPNYRLGSLGFLHLGGLHDDEPDGGVCGLLDQLTALRWVAENVAAFGGDPRRVTVFGASAGGKSIGCHLSSASARGLFQRAIVSSGGAEHVATSEVGTRLAERFVTELGLGPTPSMAELRALPTAAVLAAQERLGSGIRAAWIWRPTLHPDLLPVMPIEAIAAGSAAGIDLVIGNGANEAAAFMAFDAAGFAAPWRDVATEVFGAAALDLVRGVYGRTRGARDETEVAAAVLGDERYGIPTQRLADAQSSHARVWRARVDAAPFGASPALRGTHCVDFTLVWGPRPPGPIDPARQQVARQIHDAWLSFIRGGEPVAHGLPEWPVYDTRRRPVMVFDDESHVELDPRPEERRLWDDREWSSGTWFPIPEPAGS